MCLVGYQLITCCAVPFDQVMQYSPRLDDLKVLECFLKDQLHAHMGRIVPLTVQCIYKEHVLWVLCQHPPETVIDTQETFRVLEKILQAEEPVVQLPVRVYLRIAGQQQPYGVENFNIYPVVKSLQNEPDSVTPPTKVPSAKTSQTETSQTESFPTNQSNLTPPMPPPPPTGLPNVPVRSSAIPSIQPVDPIIDPLTVPATAHPTVDSVKDTLVNDTTFEQMSVVNNNSDSGSPTSPVAEPLANPVQLPPVAAADFMDNSQTAQQVDRGQYDNGTDDSIVSPKSSKTGLLIGGGLGLLALGLGLFGITRPCSIGTCPQIQQSQTAFEKSVATINGAATVPELQTAQSKMQQSVTSLKAVPFWSSSYGQAQANLKNYERHSAMLDFAVSGINKAEQASQASKKQPVTPTAWQESQRLWTGAIADLEKVSTDSEVYPLAQQKLTEYQQQLATTNKSISTEATATKNLNSAKTLSLATSQKQPQAKSLVQWQALQKDWKEVGGLLAGIPAGSTAYPEAQTLKKLYEPQILVVNTKMQQEKVAGDLSQKAETAAQVAQKFQKEQKLDESLSQWNNAIAFLQKIPNDSTYQATAQQRILTYNAALKKVVTTKSQAQASKDLQQTCAGSPQVCSYQVTAQAIKVKLLPDYVQKVRKVAADANTQGDNNAKMGLISHLQSLGNTLEMVSNNNRMPIQLYLENGQLLQSYTPIKS